MSQADDIDAINRYMTTANANTPAAFKMQLDWKPWFTNLSWFDKSTNADTHAIARRKRDDFNQANKGITPAGTTAVPNQKLTIKKGSSGPNVVEWQKIIGVKPDGRFGDETVRVTIAWQLKNGLKGDGIVGTASWTKALQKNIYAQASSAVAQQQAAAKSPAAKAGVVPKTSLPTPKPVIKSSGSKLLKIGSTGQEVADWQKTLGIKVTGIFDTTTAEATKAWQIKHGLKGDGIVGDATRAASAVAPKTEVSVSKAAETAKQAASQAASAVTATIITAPEKVLSAVKETPLWLKIVGGFLGFCGVASLVKTVRAK